ncbi:putative protein TPRXL [Contarinia nasturtii]|uniref:putative protein TPRXL n=1 Tax=Contarinia nasturtii TaxID=265458 RepID=UPI0012D457ED|nr:putative protein TPRXL [Contarinia nasturtii]XP_031626055.1 putative protein TPRXL [Contarinia nasturtii]XP_031626063.1 putative protein TPRXL [Contarinia nasturtii]
MISVQSGYAGMERFGVDVGLGSPPNHRRRMRSDSVQSDLLIGANTSILSSKQENRNSLLTEKHHHHHIHHHRHHCHRCSDEIIRCPHHVALPDGEWSHSYSNLQSHAEITRSYIRAPPNKTALEINLPVQKLNMSVMKLNSPAQELNIPITMSSGGNSVASSINKSRQNPLAKLFTRISSVPTGTQSKGSSQFHSSTDSQSTSPSPSSLSSSSSLVCVASSPSSTSLSLLHTEDTR